MVPLARIDDTTWDRIKKTVAFFMENGRRLLALLDAEQHRSHPVHYVRGVLLQDVFGNGSGLMNTLVRSSIMNSFMMSVIGVNPPRQANFTMKLHGANPPDVAPLLLFSADIVLVKDDNSLITNEELADAMAAASVGGPFPLDASDIVIRLGNPISSPRLIDIEPVPPATDPISYTGRYEITFTPEILVTYPQLVLTIENPHVLGLTAIVVNATKDVVTSYEEIVTDVYNRPLDNPWLAGSIVVCGPMVDVGLAIVSSDYRDITYTPPGTTE